MELNRIQKAAYELIQSDARFIYSLMHILQNAKNISSNYIMMCQPYIGLFAHGAEQWCKKVGFDKSPRFNEKEKEYYTLLRQNHKLFDMKCDDFAKSLMKEYQISDDYFYRIRGVREKIFGYYNVGTDLCNGKYCGNTLLCAVYSPLLCLEDNEVGPIIRDLSIIAGKLSAFFDCMDFPIYKYDDNSNIVMYRDYHFYKNCPLKIKNELGLVLFSVLCSINYITVFLEKYFTEEIPQKFKFAYLQYYYLCDFINDINNKFNTNFFIDNALTNREFRNCLAHYGLGQFLNEEDIVFDDMLKGLTIKAFGLNYSKSKIQLFDYLSGLEKQITDYIF